jgi:hypothetical protein
VRGHSASEIVIVIPPQEMQSPFVRIAELEIDPARLEKLGRPIEKQDI